VAPSLKEELLQRTGRFEFFQAVRLFHRIWSDRAPVGGDGDPRAEVLRFRSDLSPVFPGSDVREASAPGSLDPGGLLVTFFGVATPASFGSLPRRYAEEVRQQVREKNAAPRDFLDLFNHRFISLFYRAWERHQPAVLHEGGRGNPFERALYGILGLGTEGLSNRLPVDDRMLISRAGLLAMRPLSASAMESLIRSVFEADVHIEQFIPAGYEIEEDDQNRLGIVNTCLNEDLYLGGEIVLIHSKFRVRVGPLDFSEYREFLPDRPAFRSLAQLVRFATGEGRDVDAQLVLEAAEVPALQLGGSQEGPCRLGWSSWLGGRDFVEPVDDAIFDLETSRELPAMPQLEGNGSGLMEVSP
jgi:type VI secretion system protein ImpH